MVSCVQFKSEICITVTPSICNNFLTEPETTVSSYKILLSVSCLLCTCNINITRRLTVNMRIKMRLPSISLLVFLSILHQSHQIKKVDVESDRNVLYTDRATEVRCDYIKRKSEQLYKITWSLSYTNVETDILR